MSSLNIYQEQADAQVMEDFVHQHRSLVKKIALYMKKRLPSHIELDDLLQSGFIGLLEAKKKFNLDKGASFETFASIRIHGAMIDSLRKNSWATRDALKNMKKIADVISKLEQKEHRPPTHEEISLELGLNVEDYMQICQQISVCNILNLDLIDEASATTLDEQQNPQEINQKDELIGLIKKELTFLPQREQLVLSLYYIEEFTMKQIGEILELTEARICQLHCQAISKLKNRCKA